MGIELYCGDKSFECSYGDWYNVRRDLVEATFEYLKVHFAIAEYGENTFEYNSMTILNQYIEIIQNGIIISKQSSLLDEYYVYSNQLKFIDLLIQFSVGGLYSLCNKNDCEGFYSVGNSYDICVLLKLVKPFLLKNKDNLDSPENLVYGWIDDITAIFKESVDKNEFVLIQ